MDDQLDLYSDLDITDNDLIAENPELVVRTSGIVGKIVALFLGLIIGFGACVGTFLMMLNYTSVGYGIDMLSGFTGLTFDDAVENKLISEKYGDKSLLQLMADAATAASADTLGELNEIFPILGEYMGSLTDNAKNEFGVELDRETMLSTPLNQMPTYVGDAVKTTPIGSMLSASNTTGSLDPMLLEICYGEENVTYRLNEDGEVEMIEPHEPLTILQLSNEPGTAFERVSIASVINPSTNDSLMLSFAYGQEGVTFEIVTNDQGKEEVQMKQLFLTQDDEGNFIDYLGAPIACATTVLDNGFIEIVEYRKDANGNAVMKNGEKVVKSTYYVKDDGTGVFKAYTQPTDTAEPALFKKTLISDLQDDSSAAIDNILLKDALNIKFEAGKEDPHNILISLAYGTAGVDYKIVGTGNNREIVMIGDAKPRTIGDLKARGNDLINDLLLADIMQENRDSAITMYLLYGKEGIHYNFVPVLDELGNPVLGEGGAPLTEVAMNERFIYVTADNKVYNEYGEALTERTDVAQGYILDTTAKTFTDRLDNVYYYDTISTTEEIMGDGVTAYKCYLLNEDGEAVLFQKTSLGMMARSDNPIEGLTRRLTISDILGEESIQDNKFLKHLGNESIDNLPQAVEKLTVMQVFGEDMYLTANSSYVDNNGVEVQPGDYVDSNGNYVDEENRVMSGMWEFMLTDQTGTLREDYSIAKDMNTMIDNMEYNVRHESLSTLNEKGIMEFEETMLERPILNDVKGYPVEHGLDTTGKTCVGDLTTKETIIYLDALLGAIDNLP